VAGIDRRVKRRTIQTIRAINAPRNTNGNPKIRKSQKPPRNSVVSPPTVAEGSRCRRPPNTALSPPTDVPASSRKVPTKAVASPPILPSSSTIMLPPNVVTSPLTCPRIRTLHPKQVASSASSPGPILILCPHCVRSLGPFANAVADSSSTKMPRQIWECRDAMGASITAAATPRDQLRALCHSEWEESLLAAS
jgi:hypothetical protein